MEEKREWTVRQAGSVNCRGTNGVNDAYSQVKDEFTGLSFLTAHYDTITNSHGQ